MEFTAVTDRKFGVEIEFAGNKDAVIQAVRDRGITVDYMGYTHRVMRAWKVVSDSSCGWEMVSPILQGEDGLYELETVLEAMTQGGARITRSTGVHVHLDASNLTRLDVMHIVKRYAENESTIDSWMPRSRRGNNNTYCRSVSGVANHLDLQSEGMARTAAGVTSKFYKVNTAHLNGYGTIEFRQHGGSTDFAKVGNWVLFLQHFVEASRKMKAGFGNSAIGDRKRWYAEIRTQIESRGGSVNYNSGTKKWDLVGDAGSVALDNTEMAGLYAPQSVRANGKTVGRTVYFNVEKWNAVWGSLFGNQEFHDGSLNAEVPASVVEFFENRAAQLAA